MDFNRDFILRTTEGEPISHDLDKNDRHLFAGLTQEYVEMDRRVRIEKAERVAEDARLQAEIDKLSAKLKDLEARVAALEAKP